MTDDAQARIAEMVAKSDVLLFMKGSPLFPQCGFSSRAVAILNHLGAEFDSVDVLQDQGVRQGIKAFSDWPTIPQLYVKGEFVGGSDIMMEMYESGELAQLLEDQGVASAGVNVPPEVADTDMTGFAYGYDRSGARFRFCDGVGRPGRTDRCEIGGSIGPVLLKR